MIYQVIIYSGCWWIRVKLVCWIPGYWVAEVAEVAYTKDALNFFGDRFDLYPLGVPSSPYSIVCLDCQFSINGI